MKLHTDGYYRSDLLRSEDWHAGVRMTDEYYRFVSFFSDQYWIWTDRSESQMDVAEFLSTLDLKHLRENHRRVDPPTTVARDHNYLYQFGTYGVDRDEIQMTFHSSLADLDLNFSMKIVGDGEILEGFGGTFRYSDPNALTSNPGQAEQGVDPNA